MVQYQSELWVDVNSLFFADYYLPFTTTKTLSVYTYWGEGVN